MAEDWRFALAALGDLTTARGQRFTTAEIARRAGETSRQAGKWTEPWRDSLYALMLAGLVSTPEGNGDSGGASRFYYTAKASRAEREAGLREAGLREAGPNERTYNPKDDLISSRNVHPTVKPIDLMRWLVRLVTPPGGTVLDPFTGSGTTGIAASLEGFDFIGIEREAEYAEIAEARIAWWEGRSGDTAEILRAVGLSEKVEREHRERGQLSLENP